MTKIRTKGACYRWGALQSKFYGSALSCSVLETGNSFWFPFVAQERCVVCIQHQEERLVCKDTVTVILKDVLGDFWGITGYWLTSVLSAVLDCARSSREYPGSYDGSDRTQERTGLRCAAGLRLPTSQGL